MKVSHSAGIQELKWAIAAACLVFFPVHGLRADSVTFSDPLALLPTGTISSAGGSSPLIGTNIPITKVEGPDGVEHDVHLVGGLGPGLLNFETGDYTDTTAAGDLVYGSTGPDDFIQIYGTVPDAGVLGPPTPLLLSGTLVGAIVDPQLGTIQLGLELGAGYDQQNPALLSYFGIPENTEFSFVTVLITPTIVVAPDNSFDAGVLSTTVSNSIVAAAVPEPSSALLGFSSLILIAGVLKLGRAREPRC
jgi:hypothetical protein